MLRTTISKSELKSRDIPLSNAEWKDIVRFAHTFNGFLEAGSFEDAGTLANKYLNAPSNLLAVSTLSELRICLFFEQRRWNHDGREPEGENLMYIRLLVEEIRSRVES